MIIAPAVTSAAALRREPPTDTSTSNAAARNARLAAAVAGATFVVMCVLVLFARRGPTYDEPWYLGTVALLDRYGLTPEFLRRLPGPAGPLYTLVQIVARPLTGLHAPGVRLVNLALVLGTVLLVGRCMRLLHPDRRDLTGTDLLAVPGLGACACLALTEVPAMFLATLAVLLLLLAVRPATAARAADVMLALAGGMSLGLAVTGRQPYLLILLAVPALVFGRPPQPGMQRPLWPAVAFVAAALAVCAPMFAVWGGLVPPSITRVSRGLVPAYAVLGAAYAGVIMAVLAPRYLDVPRRWLAAALVGGLMVNEITHVVEITPLTSVVARFLSPSLVAVYASLVSGVLFGAALIFVVASLRNAWARRDDAAYAFVALAGLAILASCAKVTHQFSSRYVVVASPLLVLAASYFTQSTRWKALRFGAAAVVNLLSVWSYLYR